MRSQISNADWRVQPATLDPHHPFAQCRDAVNSLWSKSRMIAAPATTAVTVAPTISRAEFRTDAGSSTGTAQHSLKSHVAKVSCVVAMFSRRGTD